MKKGILTHAKKPHEHDTTKFKLLVYYSKKLSGEYYTQYEKQANKNRKYHDSIDFILTSGGYATRHDVALQKLLNHLTKFKSHIERSLLFMNDFGNNKQFLIGKFEADETKNLFVQPIYTNYEKLIYKEKIFFDLEDMQKFEIQQKQFTLNNIFAIDLVSKPIDVFELKQSVKPIKQY